MKWGSENGIEIIGSPFDPERSLVGNPDPLSCVLTGAALKTLAEKAGTPHFQPMFKISLCTKEHYLIAISSNYRFLKDRKTVQPSHIETFYHYLKEQGIVSGPPAWYLDYEDFRWRRVY